MTEEPNTTPQREPTDMEKLRAWFAWHDNPTQPDWDKRTYQGPFSITYHVTKYRP